MADKIRGLLVPCGAKPRIVEYEHSLKNLQRFVEGNIELLPIFGPDITCWVNEEGLYSCIPNRAVYADAWMEEQDFVSQFDFRHVVKEGEPYTIVFGNMLFEASPTIDDEGDERYHSLSDERIAELSKRFEDPATGVIELIRVRMGIALEEVGA